MKTIVMEKPATVYAQEDLATTLAEVHSGSQLEMGGVHDANGRSSKDGEQVGASPTLRPIQQDEEVELIAPAVAPGAANSVKVRDAPGTEGYIDGDTTLLDAGQIGVASAEAQREANQKAARSNIFVGAIMCIVGILVTITTYNSAKESGGSYWIAWGPVVFGAWRFLKGLVSLGGD